MLSTPRSTRRRADVTTVGAPRRYFEGERPPPEPFAEHVLALWTFDVRIPDGQSALRVPMRSGLVLRGLRLWPDTAASVLGVDPVAIRDLTRPAAEVLGVGALSLARAVARAADDSALDTVWDEWLAPRIAVADLPQPDVRHVVRRLIDTDGTHDIAAAATEAGVSMRQLENRFGAAVGLSPRQFARIRRVRAAIGAIAGGERSLVELAHRATLQPASFVREFRLVAGLAPDALMNQLDQLEHAEHQRVSAS